MIYTYLLHVHAWALSVARQSFTHRQLAAGGLACMLLLGAGLLAGAGPALAQDAAVPPPATVNINTADAEALAEGLKGVGPARAQEIVRYRESYGPFSSVEELIEVQGISKHTLDKNRAVITLE